MNGRLRVAVIIGSTRVGRFGPTVAGWFAGRARRRRDFDVEVIDLADANLPDRLTDDVPPPPVRQLAAKLESADAFVIVTPEYNRSYPAPVKAAIDWYCSEFSGKPVTFVSYGRESGGMHAVAHLREVFAELNAVAIRDCVSLPCYWDQYAADGSWPKGSGELEHSVGATLDQLAWWGFALRDARAQQPCPH